MTQPNRELAELIVAKVTANEALLDRFLKDPGAVIVELTRVDQATLDLIGERLRDRLNVKPAGELSDADLDTVAGGLVSRIATWRPILGRSFSFSNTLTMT
jgi:hypothetical protein